MTRLCAALDEARQGTGHVVVVQGEAGVGKSRLLAAMAAEAKGCRVLLGRCHDTEQILPFGPWVDALRSGGLDVTAESLRGLPSPWRAELARLLPELAPGTAGAGAGPPDRLKLFEAVTGLVRHLADPPPLLLMLEDLHWADEMTLRLLSFLSHRVQGWPVLVVATAREEEVADVPMLCRTLEELQREAHVTRLDLRPLSRGATGDLVRLLVHSGLAASDVARLAEQIWHTSEGNPFVVVETIRALDQEVVTSGSTALSLPERVRQLIARRLDRLTESSRQLLAVAAIIGREFEFALVQRAAGVDEGEAAEAIEELVRRHLLEVVGDRFDFTHDRIREAVRRGLLPPRHKLLSRRVAEAIEAHHASNLEPHHLALASHYRDGEVWEQAVHHFRQAGTRATARSASREAVACFEQALAALGHLPPSRDTREHAIDLRFEMRRPLGLLGETGRLLEVLREAEALALGLGDQSRLRQVTGHMTACRIVMGDLEGAVESGERALSLAAAARDFGLQVMANFELGRAYTGLGKFRRAIGAFGQNIEMLRGELVREHFGMPNLPAIMSRIWVGGCLARLGEFGAASASATEAIRLAETLDHPSSLVAAYMTLGQVHLAQDDLAAAIPSLERSLELCQKVSFAFQFPALARDLGRAYSRAGRVADGLLLVQRAAEQSASMRLGAIHASCLSALGEIHLRAGRSAEALRSVQQALDLFRVTKQRGAEAEAEWILGDIRSARAPSGLEEAEAAYRQSLSLANELGMRPLMARCHLSHGRLCRLAGRAPEAREHVATATTMFREMGMRRGVEDAEAEMRLVG